MILLWRQLNEIHLRFQNWDFPRCSWILTSLAKNMEDDPFSASLTLLTNAKIFSLREFHSVARQNLIASTQESIARQLSAWAQDDASFGKETSMQQQGDKVPALPLWNNDDLLCLEGLLPEAPTCVESSRCDISDVPSTDLDHSTPQTTTDVAASIEESPTAKQNKELVCNEPGCGRKFIWRAHLRYHKQTHMGSRPHMCQVASCGRKFVTAQQLQVHARVHTGERPFTCQQCGDGFTTANNLRNHCRSKHTGERPFSCTQAGCEKRFAERSSLKKHIVVHTGEKPFVCQFCDKRFSQSSCRSTHVNKFHLPG
ncbi:zinc finger protein 410-like [Ornithodoros turicata]|uniref:zinc finger protein 410-like n=1 Tax=Ornithodoros turicata TaxID=34597 RepID=UPI0031398905